MKTENNKLKDRFFLEEIVYRLKNKDIGYVETLTGDWLQEMVEKNPMTEQERKSYIKNVLGWDDDFTNSAYFKSEKQLKSFLKG